MKTKSQLIEEMTMKPTQPLFKKNKTGEYELTKQGEAVKAVAEIHDMMGKEQPEYVKERAKEGGVEIVSTKEQVKNNLGNMETKKTIKLEKLGALAKDRSDIAKKLIMNGDLSQLTDREKLIYYKMRCDEQGLDPFSQPFSYLELKGKHVLYANKNAAEQLRALHKISIEIIESKEEAGCYVVVARASKPDGRVDTAIAAVPIDKLMGDARANAIMKAETKAKRRVTLSIQGLNMMDETEVETIPDAKKVDGGFHEEEVINVNQ